MTPDDNMDGALVPVVKGRVVAGRVRIPAKGVRARALALRPDAALVRRAALVGLAFGVGFQLSRVLHSRRATDTTAAARDAVRPPARADGAERAGAGTVRWVRRSMTVLSVAYGIVERYRIVERRRS
jgi:hypothetical protein